MAQKINKVVYLTNIPAPYREKMHELLGKHTSITYSVIYCAKIEPNRKWKFKSGDYENVFLKLESKTLVHNNINIFRYLNKYNPDFVVGTGYTPTMLYSFVWCILRGRKFIPFTDGTFTSELHLSIVHRLVRKLVFKFAPAFIGASNGSFDLYKSYGIMPSKLFKSCLCIENEKYSSVQQPVRKYDLMFSGQLVTRKMPFFFIEVARQVKQRMGNCKILILGDGALKNEVFSKLDEYGIDYDYPGFIQPEDLPAYYNQSKIFLFPTLNDPWGVVANEACASGVPVITCTNAGVAGDLIINDYNGYILPLEQSIWIDQVCKILEDKNLLQRLSINATASVKMFNSYAAAEGIADAIKYCHS